MGEPLQWGFSRAVVPNFLVRGTDFVEDSLSMDWG